MIYSAVSMTDILSVSVFKHIGQGYSRITTLSCRVRNLVVSGPLILKINVQYFDIDQEPQ